MTPTWCRAALLLLIGSMLGNSLLLPAPAANAEPIPGATHAAPTANDDKLKQELVERYSPILVVRKHDTQCGDGEPFLPMDVDLVFGRSDVVLHTPTGVIKAPTERQIAAAPESAYLDFPGNPLNPGCTYEQWYDTIRDGTKPTIYARVTTDLDAVIVQYYFFYAFNDWNDLHEGDWEMMQVQFDAPTLADALELGPDSTAYAQHEGAETADWFDADHLWLVDDTHPVVYPGEGSHASYYTQAVWLGRSAATGFGCDDTSAPGSQIRPVVKLLPTQVPDSLNDPYAWLKFEGRWGQKESGFNNGPTGPATKTQWPFPVLWAQIEGRPSAVALPPTPSAASDGFCTMVAGGSKLFVTVLDRPWLVVVLSVVALVLIMLLTRRTRWRGGEPWVIDRKRQTGQILTSTISVAFRLTRPMVPLTMLLAAASTLSSWIASRGVRNDPDYDNITDVSTAAAGLGPIMFAALSWVALYLIEAICVAVVVELVQQLAENRPPRLLTALRDVATHRTPVYTFLAAAALVTITFSTFWLIPVSLILLSMWSVSFVAAAIEDLPLRAALTRSGRLTHRRRLKSTALSLLLLFAAAVTGPVLAGILLLATNWPIWVDNLASAVVTAVIVPAAIIGVTMLYFDLRNIKPVGAISTRTSSERGGPEPSPA